GDIIPCTDLDFELSSDGTYYIIKGIGTFEGSNLLLPSEHNGKPVKEIKESSFRNDTRIKKVIIPATIEYVGDFAFMESALKELYIEGADTEFGRSVFYYSISLHLVKLPDGLKAISPFMFNSCLELTEIQLGSKLEKIGEYAFAGSGLISIVIPDSVTVIEQNAFASAVNLESVTLGKGLKSIGNRAFTLCSDLRSIVIPDGVVALGDSVFKKCSTLETIVIPNSVSTMGRSVFSECVKLKEAVIGDGIEVIPTGTFEKCYELKKLTLGKNVREFGDDYSTFDFCTQLIEFHVTSLESWNNITNKVYMELYVSGYKVYVNGEVVFED
ncbi:MAG: leucine-rich repeat domain-containing protein, partial [Clostridia bacterium]|nr:leucine-rich repeat domain-containing protein [Clostridia bacterium]